ncbi:MAG: PilZ domain-containing protein [Deltaproteobacteria bacterium]|nr:PilZ domain-containing protein [Deltaproteobacteria bacterium]
MAWFKKEKEEEEQKQETDPAAQREFVRLDDFIGFAYEPLGDASKEKDVKDVIVEGQGYEPASDFMRDMDVKRLDPGLVKVLIALDQKLNFILKCLTEKDTLFKMPTRKNVNISGAGISFTAAEEFQKGAKFKLKMVLSSYPYSILGAVGEVVRVIKEDIPEKDGKPVRVQREFPTAVRFIVIDDGTREMIIHHIFNKQREIIKQREMVKSKDW